MFITNNDSKEHKDEINDDRNKAQWSDVYEENEKMIHV